MDDTEREMINNAQHGLTIIKKRLERLAMKLREIAAMNREAGRMEESNDAMRFQGVVLSALGDLTQGHADASNALLKHWPDEGGDIIIAGGGGR